MLVVCSVSLGVYIDSLLAVDLGVFLLELYRRVIVGENK